MTSWTERYLALLGVDVPAPTLDGLRAIAAVHPRRVPFENISAILRRRDRGIGPVPPLDLDAALDAWCARRGGGVCFEVTAMVDRLLSELGYRTHPVLAQITFPGSHQANGRTRRQHTWSTWATVRRSWSRSRSRASSKSSTRAPLPLQPAPGHERWLRTAGSRTLATVLPVCWIARPRGAGGGVPTAPHRGPELGRRCAGPVGQLVRRSVVATRSGVASIHRRGQDGHTPVRID